MASMGVVEPHCSDTTATEASNINAKVPIEDDTDSEDNIGADRKGKDISERRKDQNRKFAAW